MNLGAAAAALLASFMGGDVPRVAARPEGVFPSGAGLDRFEAGHPAGSGGLRMRFRRLSGMNTRDGLWRRIALGGLL